MKYSETAMHYHYKRERQTEEEAGNTEKINKIERTKNVLRKNAGCGAEVGERKKLLIRNSNFL